MTEEEYKLKLISLQYEVSFQSDCMYDAQGDSLLRSVYINRMHNATKELTEFKLKYPEFKI